MNKTVFAVVSLILVGAGCTNTVPYTRSEVSNTKDVNGQSTSPPIEQNSSTSLSLSGQSLTRVPGSVFQQTSLERLDVSNNKLTGALQGEIRLLTKLRVLDASDNQMTGVPAEIGQLSALEELDLSNNQLTGLPLELGNLTQLRILNLRGNNVSKIDLDQIRLKLNETQIILE